MYTSEIIVRLLVVYLMLSTTSGFDYCTYKECGPKEHTLCRYSPGSIACGGSKVKVGLHRQQRSALLDAHNRLRARVAKGEEKGQPGASNMMKMVWSREAETIAQRWTNQCQVGHDLCRGMKDGTVAGQNAAGGNLNLKEGANATKAVVESFEVWYKEVEHMNVSQIDLFTSMSGTNGSVIGHYTQLVSADTKILGCGYLEKQPDNEFFQSIILICNYVPAGNLMGAPVYKRGEACSACPQGTHCSQRFPGLCTGEKDEYDDIPPDTAARPHRGSCLLLFTLGLMSRLLF